MNESNLSIYSASVMFLAGNITHNYPVCSTSRMYASFQSFQDYCLLEAQQSQLFGFSNISIAIVEAIQLPNGTLRKQKYEVIDIENYNSAKAKLYLSAQNNN